MFKSTGIIELHGDGWIIISVCPELTRYYLSRFNRSRVATDIQIMKPKWGGHISLVCGEDCDPPDIIKNKEFLPEIKDKLIEFEYSHISRDNGNHFWLDVKCEEALDMREKLGLKRDPFFDLHLTFGVIISIN